MKSDSPSLRFEKLIKAPVKDVYRAFTKQSSVTEWLCNIASLDVSIHTRLYLWWDTGYYACGEFIKVVPEKELIFSWLGRDDPGKTRVRVTIKGKDSSTHLVVEHRGMRNTPKWAPSLQKIRQGWELALNNLVCILENGQDLRLVNRPMIGINIDEFTPAVAEKIGVPVTHGVLIEGTIDGMGAQKCGLQKNDVLVEVDGQSLLGFTSLNPILMNKKAGDAVDIAFYRGPKKMTATLELSLRPVPEIPATPAELSQVVAQLYEQGDQVLESTLEGVSEQEASFKIAPAEWSVKEVLAHLIHTERDWQFAINKWISGEDTGYAPNLDARIRATVSAFPTIPDLMQELKRSEVETIELLRNLPDDFVGQKDSFWVLAYNQVQFKGHTSEHIDQINASIAAARGK
jgi:uncharacterized protein YndB with AHSA1/START domain